MTPFVNSFYKKTENKDLPHSYMREICFYSDSGKCLLKIVKDILNIFKSN